MQYLNNTTRIGRLRTSRLFGEQGVDEIRSVILRHGQVAFGATPALPWGGTAWRARSRAPSQRQCFRRHATHAPETHDSDQLAKTGRSQGGTQRCRAPQQAVQQCPRMTLAPAARTPHDPRAPHTPYADGKDCVGILRGLVFMTAAARRPHGR